MERTTTSFGWIKYNDKMYNQDILITVSGNVILRKEDELRAKYGTMHAIDKSEVELLLKEKPRTIFFGTGQTGMARLSKDAHAILMKSMTRIVECSTPEAIKKFDMAGGPKAAIFHVTC